MKKALLILLLAQLYASNGFFETEEQIQAKEQVKKDRLCEVFTKKALDYKEHMRDDELAYITLDSYQKRKAIYCENAPMNPNANKKEVKAEELSKVMPINKKIALEDERLCKIFKNKALAYKESMRNDALAFTTLDSYNERARIFCSADELEVKEKKVLSEDERLCKVFTQGPLLCNLFNKKLNKEDGFAKLALQSYKKRADVFCSSKPLKEKDKIVYSEHENLCKVLDNKLELYKKEVEKDKSKQTALESYQERIYYFCISRPKDSNTSKISSSKEDNSTQEPLK